MSDVLRATPPDTKPAPRIVDPKASRRKLLADRVCRACGQQATNCHHLLGKGGRRGDDVVENMIPLCGSGSHGCHGALHGTPHRHAGRRWEARDVRLAIGLALRPLEYARLVETLAAAPAAEYLRSAYHVEVASTDPLVMREAT